MQISSKSLFSSGLKCQNKLYFTNINIFADKNSDNSFLKLVLFSVAMLIFFSSCEQKSIDNEILRLQTLEKELIN